MANLSLTWWQCCLTQFFFWGFILFLSTFSNIFPFLVNFQFWKKTSSRIFGRGWKNKFGKFVDDTSPGRATLSLFMLAFHVRNRSSHQRCSLKKVLLEISQVFSCEFCKNFKNTFFSEYLWTTASNENQIHQYTLILVLTRR